MKRDRQSDDLIRTLARPLWLARGVILAERAARAFWPSATVLMTGAALWQFSVLSFAPLWLGQVLVGLILLAGLTTLFYGIGRFRLPRRSDALARLDEDLPDSPIATLTDAQAIGVDDPASRAIWQAHLARMEAALAALRPPRPYIRLAGRDPYALRLIAATALGAALIFGAGSDSRDLAALAPGANAALAEASWEGWITPPSHTGKPTLYLADQPTGPLSVPEGSRVTLRLYGKLGAIRVEEDFSDTQPDADSPSRSFTILGDGRLSIGRDSWQISTIPDMAPRVQPAGELTRTLAGEMRLPFHARDDYGIASGQARISLDLPRVSRRYGLVTEPEPREDMIVDLPLPYRGDRSDIDDQLVESLAAHPWAGLPVLITLSVTDGAGQAGQSAPSEIILPGRRFLNKLAAAIIEQRRDILWSRDNAPRVARILRALAYRPEGYFTRGAHYLALKAVARDLAADGLTAEARDAAAEALWTVAVEIEDGALLDALENLRRARERLAEAMRQGASPEELSQLMEEYRQAMRDYTDQLQARDPNADADQPDSGGQSMTMSQQDLQAMMDRIEELMREGRMAEAQELLDQLQQMMENAQVAQSGQGQGGAGQQAMNGLAETLRDQQELSDQTFGQQQGQSGQQGQQGQPGAGDEGEPQSGGGAGQDLAQRQRGLAQDLETQRQQLPGAGSAAGDAAREALDQAGRAMDDAAEALERGDISGALDNQAQAMEDLRDGMRNLRDATRQAGGQGEAGDQGQMTGRAGGAGGSDPLGRAPSGSDGGRGSNGPLNDGEDVYRRAQELTDELRRRSGEQERPEQERDYLKRLLDLF
ncbi:MAG: TIGR02302 family protein [Maritimibacter sp.]